MKRLVRTELLKQRTTRTFLAGLAAALLLSGLMTVAILGAAGKQGNGPLGPESLVQAVGAPAALITVIALFLGLLSMAGEHRHGTITTTFLASPRRRDVVIAKLAAGSLVGALIGVLSVAISTAIAVAWLRLGGVPLHLDATTATVAFGLVLSSSLYGALGVSIGALLRNQTAGAAAVLVWLLALEGLIGKVSHDAAFVHWLPAAAGRALVGVGPGDVRLAPPLAAAVFATYVAVIAVVGTRITLSRDIT